MGIVHKCMVPPDVEGTVMKLLHRTVNTRLKIPRHSANFPTEQKGTAPCDQHWPIRNPRPTQHRFPAYVPLITGQRILDTMFPIAKGGTAAIPGGFGTGKP